MLNIQRLACLIFPIILGTAADQITKSMARDLLTPESRVTCLFGLVQFQYIENHAGFLGYLQLVPENPRLWLLTIGVGLALVAVAAGLLFYNGFTSRQRIVTAFVLAGGTGNLLDRVLNNGGVTDFVSIGISPIKTGIFNLADLFILAGTFYLGFAFAAGNSKD